MGKSLCICDVLYEGLFSSPPGAISFGTVTLVHVHCSVQVKAGCFRKEGDATLPL